MNIYHILFVFLFIPLSSWALIPSPNFSSRADIGFVENFHDEINDVALSKMGSDFDYKDLTAENIKELDQHHDTKREFGKMFGFNDWKITSHKFIENASGRVLVFEGNYKSNRNTLVSFLEVYWATPKTSKQFLLTSEKKNLKVDEYQEYLVP